jgi:hypothetical protein
MGDEEAVGQQPPADDAGQDETTGELEASAQDTDAPDSPEDPEPIYGGGAKPRRTEPESIYGGGAEPGGGAKPESIYGGGAEPGGGA